MAKTEEATGTDITQASDDKIAGAIAGGEVEKFLEDPFEVSKAIVSRILSAETREEILSQGAALHARDVLGRAFTALGIRWNQSSYRNEKGAGPGVFAVIDAEFHDDGARAAITCGSMNVMAQLYKLAAIGELSTKPLMIKETETQTAQGFRPMWLVEA